MWLFNHFSGIIRTLQSRSTELYHMNHETKPNNKKKKEQKKGTNESIGTHRMCIESQMIQDWAVELTYRLLALYNICRYCFQKYSVEGPKKIESVFFIKEKQKKKNKNTT